MNTNQQILEQLNLQIGVEESKGDDNSQRWFNDLLAPEFAFLRADRVTFDNRDKFIEKIKPSDKRETDVISINTFGNRAVVGCIVTLKFSKETGNFITYVCLSNMRCSGDYLDWMGK